MGGSVGGDWGPEPPPPCKITMTEFICIMLRAE